MASGNAEARISDGRTCSATKNEIGSINAACASAPLTVVDDEGVAARRERRGWAGKSVCTRARARDREGERVYSRAARNERDGETTNPRLRHVE